jgi:hypothetical protein
MELFDEFVEEEQIHLHDFVLNELILQCFFDLILFYQYYNDLQDVMNHDNIKDNQTRSHIDRLENWREVGKIGHCGSFLQHDLKV